MFWDYCSGSNLQGELLQREKKAKKKKRKEKKAGKPVRKLLQ